MFANPDLLVFLTFCCCPSPQSRTCRAAGFCRGRVPRALYSPEVQRSNVLCGDFAIRCQKRFS